MKLLTDHIHYDMVENLIRKVTCSVISKRLATLNNKYLEGFDETKLRTYVFLVDANNLYGGIRQNFHFHCKNFEIADVELSSILKSATDSKSGSVLEVGLD